MLSRYDVRLPSPLSLSILSSSLRSVLRRSSSPCSSSLRRPSVPRFSPLLSPFLAPLLFSHVLSPPSSRLVSFLLFPSPLLHCSLPTPLSAILSRRFSSTPPASCALSLSRPCPLFHFSRISVLRRISLPSATPFSCALRWFSSHFLALISSIRISPLLPASLLPSSYRLCLSSSANLFHLPSAALPLPFLPFSPLLSSLVLPHVLLVLLSALLRSVLTSPAPRLSPLHFSSASIDFSPRVFLPLVRSLSRLEFDGAKQFGPLRCDML